MKVSELTSSGNYYEDFVAGDVLRHGRGKTIGELENILFTNLVLNTADAHFDEHKMSAQPPGHRVVYGGVTASLVIGLATQDTSENALEEIGIAAMKLTHPVLHGHTIYAESEVIAVKDVERSDAGEVWFRHIGRNQDGITVCEIDRRVLIKRRSHWGGR